MCQGGLPAIEAIQRQRSTSGVAATEEESTVTGGRVGVEEPDQRQAAQRGS